MTEDELKVYTAKAAILKALAHPTRLYMAETLLSGPRCVCEFVKEIEADVSTVSKHLSVLKSAGIVADERRGRQIFYRLKVPCIMKFAECAMTVLEKNADETNAIIGKDRQ